MEYVSGQCKDGSTENIGNSIEYTLPERIRAHVKFLSSGKFLVPFYASRIKVFLKIICIIFHFVSPPLIAVSSLVNAQHDLSAVTSSDLRATVRDTILDATKGAMPQTLIAFHRGTVCTATLYTLTRHSVGWYDCMHLQD